MRKVSTAADSKFISYPRLTHRRRSRLNCTQNLKSSIGFILCVQHSKKIRSASRPQLTAAAFQFLYSGNSFSVRRVAGMLYLYRLFYCLQNDDYIFKLIVCETVKDCGSFSRLLIGAFPLFGRSFLRWGRLRAVAGDCFRYGAVYEAVDRFVIRCGMLFNFFLAPFGDACPNFFKFFQILVLSISAWLSSFFTSPLKTCTYSTVHSLYHKSLYVSI